MNYTVDAQGLDVILGFEGNRDVVYPDSRGLATVGVGHLLHMSAPTARDHQAYDHKGRAFYERLLASDVRRVCTGPMDSALRVPLNQHQIDAVASAAFNCGPGFIYGTVGKLINAKQFHAAADAFMHWITPAVLKPRREQERALFLSPVPHIAFPWLTTDERRWVLEYDQLKRQNKNQARRKTLRLYMRRQAVKIAYAAKHDGGWEKANRRHRYASLAARS